MSFLFSSSPLLLFSSLLLYSLLFSSIRLFSSSRLLQEMAKYRKGKVDALHKQREQHKVELIEKLAARETRVKESYAAHAVEVRS